MLDWLAAETNTPGGSRARILEGPETPAPIFAYRALKSVLFGAHDDLDSEDEKENIPVESREVERRGNTNVPALPKLKLSTPTKPTPRAFKSPSKGILRTPAIAGTPRRQNVLSVKFKDAKRASCTPSSVYGPSSPLELIKSKPLKTPVFRHSKASRADAVTPREFPVSEAADTTQEALSGNTRGQPLKQSSEDFYDKGETDAYIAATEREMKRLVRYGQRMREYARVSQDEVSALKEELEHLRRRTSDPQHMGGDRTRTNRSRVQSTSGPSSSANDALFELSPSSKLEPHQTEQGERTKQVEQERETVSQPERRPNGDSDNRDPRPTQQHRRHTANPLLSPISPNRIPSHSHQAQQKHKSHPSSALPPKNPSPPKSSRKSPSPSTLRKASATRLASRTSLAQDKISAVQARLQAKNLERKSRAGQCD